MKRQCRIFGKKRRCSARRIGTESNKRSGGLGIITWTMLRLRKKPDEIRQAHEFRIRDKQREGEDMICLRGVSRHSPAFSVHQSNLDAFSFPGRRLFSCIGGEEKGVNLFAEIGIGKQLEIGNLFDVQKHPQHFYRFGISEEADVGNGIRFLLAEEFFHAP